MSTNASSTPSTKYKLQDWERNGHDDSDFYGVYYDSADGQLHPVMLGTTRAACPTYHFTEEYQMPTPEILEAARLVLRSKILIRLQGEDIRATLHPQPDAIQKGVALVLTEAFSGFVAEKVEGECFGCQGTGRFVARTGRDVGPCFKCKGTGKLMIKTGKKVRGEDGKCLRTSLPEGTKVEALGGVKFFGTVYKRGYNTVNRGNTTVAVRADGQTYTVPVAKLRLDRSLKTAAQLLEEADAESMHYEFAKAGGMTAWISTDFTGQARQERGGILVIVEG